jgi:hypothetical protein
MSKFCNLRSPYQSKQGPKCYTQFGNIAISTFALKSIKGPRIVFLKVVTGVNKTPDAY